MTEALPLDEPVIPASGELSRGRPEQVLRFCERVRFSGTLAFRNDATRGVLPMVNGVPEVLPAQPSIEQALDEFVALEDGTYHLTQMLPALEGATPEGELGQRGALEKVPPGDLLKYCDSVGLTGTLTLRRSERSCIARYRYGELQSLTVDGVPDADLSEVFGWDEGRFEIEGQSVFEADRPSSVRTPDATLLRTLEIALTAIIDRSAGSGSAGSSPLRPRFSNRPLAAPSILRGSTLPFGVEGAPATVRTPRPFRTVAPPPVHVDSTVKVFIVAPTKPDVQNPSATQHEPAGAGTQVVMLDPASQRLAALPLEGPPVVPSSSPAKIAVSVPLTAGFGALLLATVVSAIAIVVSLVR